MVSEKSSLYFLRVNYPQVNLKVAVLWNTVTEKLHVLGMEGRDLIVSQDIMALFFKKGVSKKTLKEEASSYLFYELGEQCGVSNFHSETFALFPLALKENWLFKTLPGLCSKDMDVVGDGYWHIKPVPEAWRERLQDVKDDCRNQRTTPLMSENALQLLILVLLFCYGAYLAIF